MQNVYLDCLVREEIGKNKLSALRQNGFVPAIVYGQDKKSLAIKINRSQLVKFMHAHQGIENMIITLRISGNEKSKTQEEKSVLIKEIQFDPVKEEILHIDFNQISLTKAIVIKVPIQSKGEAIGVKQDGGILTHVLWELEIECLPTSIPEKIEVDVTNMKIGDTVHIKDLTIPQGAKVLADSEAIVFTLVPPKKVEVAEEVAAAEAAPTEPEVIKEKKEKEEEEGEATKTTKAPEEAGAKKEAPGKKEATGKK